MIWIKPVIPTRAANTLAAIFMACPLCLHDVKQALELFFGDLAAREAPLQNRLGIRRRIPSPTATPSTPEEREAKEKEQEEHREQDPRERKPPVWRVHGTTSLRRCP